MIRINTHFRKMNILRKSNIYASDFVALIIVPGLCSYIS